MLIRPLLDLHSNSLRLLQLPGKKIKRRIYRGLLQRGSNMGRSLFKELISRLSRWKKGLVLGKGEGRIRVLLWLLDLISPL